MGPVLLLELGLLRERELLLGLLGPVLLMELGLLVLVRLRRLLPLLRNIRYH